MKTTIAMVGPTGVGKTSLLAAMYNEFQPIVIESGCTFFCEGGTKKALTDRSNELKALASGKKMKIANDVGILGSQEKREYDFTLGVPVEKRTVDVQLQFVDMPGGWYSGGGDYKTARDILANSDVTFWCIDAVALMEEQGEYHEQINEPRSIFDCYQNAASTLPDDHWIQFVLIRAESYLRGDRKRDELFDRFHKSYEQHFSQLKHLMHSRKKTLGGSVSAVQTVGNVLFHTFDVDENGKAKAVFRRDASKGFSPSGCTYPIARALEKGLDRKLGELIVEYERQFLPVLVQRLLGYDITYDEIVAVYDVLIHITDVIEDEHHIDL
ncbi:MAG: ATP-binding protein [Planctomycetaceae bacterium]|jgi:GTPase SAR1 family protein|nr:ATP-binding protein [Planctomycetaceae bacterium]